MAEHSHGPAIKSAFHPTARIAMAEMTWDPIRRVVVSPNDEVYDTMHRDDDWMAFENLDDVELPPNPTEDHRIADVTPPALPPTAAELAAGRAMMGEDDAHTIGSLRAAQQNQAPPKSNKKAQRPSTQSELDQYKKSLKGLFTLNGMDFDSDDETIQTSLSIQDQMKGMKAMMKEVYRQVATKTDMQKNPPPRGRKQDSGEQSKSGSSEGTTGVINQKDNLGDASQATT
jgi:hypothetical protein